jgi:hypothetical protein
MLMEIVDGRPDVCMQLLIYKRFSINVVDSTWKRRKYRVVEKVVVIVQKCIIFYLAYLIG